MDRPTSLWTRPERRRSRVSRRCARQLPPSTRSHPMSAVPEAKASPPLVTSATHPDPYLPWRLPFAGPVAPSAMAVTEAKGLKPGYKLKLNSYDPGVKLELPCRLTALGLAPH